MQDATLYAAGTNHIRVVVLFGNRMEKSVITQNLKMGMALL